MLKQLNLVAFGFDPFTDVKADWLRLHQFHMALLQLSIQHFDSKLLGEAQA